MSNVENELKTTIKRRLKEAVLSSNQHVTRCYFYSEERFFEDCKNAAIRQIPEVFGSYKGRKYFIYVVSHTKGEIVTGRVDKLGRAYFDVETFLKNS